ncbi:Vitellogenin-like protein [Quillaja saponaria]|uniref:Vitellogenin-like protein n=1 Tax=Quillaja saponaria TaxID=32244 RepID=A0AAD7VLR4_QUISA|nr:Vitellogenin-like protein [Quillaja saponaria]
MMMEGIKGIGGGGGGGGGGGDQLDDMGDGMQCINHPYRNNPGGICAFCLQEKLGKLVSSSFPLPIRASTSSSSSPSFRSDIAAVATASTTATATASSVVAAASSSLSLSVRPMSTNTNLNDSGNGCHYHDPYYTRRARIPFLLAKRKKKKAMVSSAAASSDIIFKRSKSTTTPRQGQYLDDVDDDDDDDDIGIHDFSPRKRNGFWSFLYLSSKSTASGKKIDKSFKYNSSRTSTFSNGATRTGSGSIEKQQKDKCLVGNTSADIVEEDDSPNSQATASASSFERKVSRSRSVGCGSRSFSGDFFERISTGFGDCTLRRVESQREGKSKVAAVNRTGDQHHHHNYMKERVRCGGIFSGFMMTSSSSSSSSSSYWVSSSADDHHPHHNMNGKSTAVALSHGRAKSWGWAFASPLRAFSSTKPSSKDRSKRDIIRTASDKNPTPDLAAIPSLLAVRS